MKIILMTGVLVAAAIYGFCAGAEGEKNPINLQLPPEIYAVPDRETNVYFDNIVLTLNPDIYFFDVDCAKGRNDAKRWRFVPAAGDIGEIPWKVRVLDSENRVVAQGETKIITVPKNAGEGKSISLLIVGDSLTGATFYPRRINELFKMPGNPAVKFVGSHAGGGKPAEADGVCHEGYGGWSWWAFCSTWTDGTDPRARSKFLTLKNGKPTLDFKAYCDQYNNGMPPDFITVMLGTNDVFATTDETIDGQIKTAFQYMDMLLGEFSRVAPQAKIGVALTVPPAHSQDAFGSNYNCGQTRWQYKRNQYRLVQAMIKKFSGNKDKNISLIPVYLNLDCENGFPVSNEPIVQVSTEKTIRQCNGVHPSETGYRQIGDSFYCWMKYQLSLDK